MGQTTSKDNGGSRGPANPHGAFSQVLGLAGAEGGGGPQVANQRKASDGGGATAAWQLEVLRQTKTIHRLTVITYEEFLENIRQLNEISSRYLDENGKQLVFAVKKGSDSTILWRATVRIACVKLDADTKRIESCRTLSLKQFIVVYNKLRHQADAATADADASPLKPLRLDVYQEISSSAEGAADPGNGCEECCICLERVPELILPCAHSYCLPCIEQWSVNNKTCPVCREKVEDIDEGWVVSEGPDNMEITTEIQKSLMDLSN